MAVGRWLSRALAVLAVLLAVTPVGTSTAAAPAPRPGPGPVVLVGVPGLRWSEIGPEATPNLWELARDSAIGDMSIRTVTSRTCPVDGWLTVSAGQRAASERQTYSICELPQLPRIEGDGAVVPGYSEHVAYNAASKFVARVGLLGDTVHANGGTTLAVGPGAALAAADSDGRVDRYLGGVAGLDEAAWDGVDLGVVDLNDLADLYLDPPPSPAAEEAEEDEEAEELGGEGPDSGEEGGSWDGGEAVEEAIEEGEVVEEEPEPDPSEYSELRERRERLTAIDEDLAVVLDTLPPGSTLMVAGISVEAGTSSLNAALLRGVGPGGQDFDHGYLTSESTRRPGLVTLTDITTTLLHAMGVDTLPGTVGRAWVEAPRPPGLTEAVGRLVEFTTAAEVVESLVPGFFSGLVALQLLIYAAAAFALKRYSDRDLSKRHLVLSVTRVVALGGAAFPVSSYLANLIPWWSAALPQLALLGSVLLADAVIVAAALAGPWRRDILAPTTIVAGITTLVLFADLCTGSNLQMNSPTGYTPIVAGRFYGLGNIAFATFATGMLMTVAGIAHLLPARGRRAWAVVAALAIGLATLFVIGWPGLGTDFGGVLAIVPGLAVTVLMIAGLRVTLSRLAVIGGGAVAVIAVLSYLDYLRPPNERSHFGLFAGQFVDGEAWPVVSRKIGAMLGSLGNWQLTLLSACALLFLFAVLNKPTDWRMGVLQRVYEYAPTLRAGLTGSLVTALAGFGLNDSGIAIPALALTVAVPLTLAACVWALQRERPPHAPRPSADGAPDRHAPV
ncbi:hypothetical protein [Actinorugispora endophytica]|uniref:Uncharacterized protein n=1 Tax=Actinorugispora endophytica TaxID=1605990 RepID=A0A4R6UZY7_9ACTN|nr:hypothetical protein [Actinorugispora endophytica]TDQ53162.1 hypothetical protein EV190_105284 [Actinorugispora endophytica]